MSFQYFNKNLFNIVINPHVYNLVSGIFIIIKTIVGNLVSGIFIIIKTIVGNVISLIVVFLKNTYVFIIYLYSNSIFLHFQAAAEA